MPSDGDDAGRCSNGLSAENFRAASAEDRAIYRAWLRGLIVFYVALLLLSGTVAFLSYRDGGHTRLMTQATPLSAESPRSPGSH